MEQGLVHLYYGDGAGKTTAAVGLAVRAAGAGLNVAFVQFLKGRPTGEREPLRRLGVRLICPDAGEKFWFAMNGEERARTARLMTQALSEAAEAAKMCDLLVLDEAVDAEAVGALPAGALEDFVDRRPAGCELVLTGHSAPASLAARADYVTRFACEKHPYEAGTAARKGVEY